MSVEQSIKSITLHAIISENKAVVMLDCPENRSNAFDMHIAEATFDFCHNLPVYFAINVSHWSCFVIVTWQICSMFNE